MTLSSAPPKNVSVENPVVVMKRYELKDILSKEKKEYIKKQSSRVSEASGIYSGLMAELQHSKICLHPNFGTCERYFIWKRDLCRCN